MTASCYENISQCFENSKEAKKVEVNYEKLKKFFGHAARSQDKTLSLFHQAEKTDDNFT
jgi:hypothetical protein